MPARGSSGVYATASVRAIRRPFPLVFVGVGAAWRAADGDRREALLRCNGDADARLRQSRRRTSTSHNSIAPGLKMTACVLSFTRPTGYGSRNAGGGGTFPPAPSSVSSITEMVLPVIRSNSAKASFFPLRANRRRRVLSIIQMFLLPGFGTMPSKPEMSVPSAAFQTCIRAEPNHDWVMSSVPVSS